jgi:hypothetical protein
MPRASDGLSGDGLYAAKLNTDSLTCVLSELDLEFFSLCPVGDKLFLGTNHGLHRLDANALAQLDEAKGK